MPTYITPVYEYKPNKVYVLRNGIVVEKLQSLKAVNIISVPEGYCDSWNWAVGEKKYMRTGNDKNLWIGGDYGRDYDMILEKDRSLYVLDLNTGGHRGR